MDIDAFRIKTNREIAELRELIGALGQPARGAAPAVVHTSDEFRALQDEVEELRAFRAQYEPMLRDALAGYPPANPGAPADQQPQAAVEQEAPHPDASTAAPAASTTGDGSAGPQQ